MKEKPTKLNALQRRTLALFQELAKTSETSSVIDGTDEISIMYLPQPHGNHVHIGNFVISSKEASGIHNEKVWQALERKGLARSEFPMRIILTVRGQNFETDFNDKFEISNH